MLSRIRKFTLKTKDFSSGKMVSPCRSTWVPCACCGKALVQGVVLSNGDQIGDDCEVVRERVRCIVINGQDFTAATATLFRSFGTPERVQRYMLAAYSGEVITA